MKFKQFAAVAAATALFAATGYLGVKSAANVEIAAGADSFGALSSFIGGGSAAVIDLPSDPYLARFDIVGSIGPSSADPLYGASYGYDHSLYMELADAIMDDENNKGILLYVDSPGGTVYESDELYLKLMEYREKTGRPIYAYFAAEACSGGYYVAMAANEIYANRNAWTGSIGVIMSLYNYEGLAEKIGVKEINITSGRNKSMGSAWETLTDEQRGILQSLVDESYGQFADIVAAGRKLERGRVLELADGRIYSAAQALELGLIDHVLGEQDAFKAIIEKAGLESEDDIYAPERPQTLGWLNLLSRANAARPKSELEIFREIVSDKRNGALMYYAG